MYINVLSNSQGDRERDFELVKRRIEDEKEELQQTINRFPFLLLCFRLKINVHKRIAIILFSLLLIFFT